MKFLNLQIVAATFLFIWPAGAQPWEFDYGGFIRTTPSFAHFSETGEDARENYRVPDAAKLDNALTYRLNKDNTLSLHFSLKADAGTHIDNLNQGKWGEEAYLLLDSPSGQYYFGQMPNAAQDLGVNRPNLSTWQATPEDIADFINNPNWRQRHHTKFYNTLNSTLINTDGSSLKFSYISPEFYNTNFGLSYIPKNNANDGLTSKFAPYFKEEAVVVALYNHFEFDFFDSEAYISYADYKKSHHEYAAGLSLYRKGWTLFGAYRQTELSDSDYEIAVRRMSTNRPAGFDGYRHAKAWNTGISYEFAMFNSTLSYFETRAKDSKARSRIINWHNSVKPYKNLGFYLGSAWVDFDTNQNNINSGKRGFAFYAGAEITF